VSEQQKPNPGLDYRLLASHESLQAGDDVYKISGWKKSMGAECGQKQMLDLWYRRKKKKSKPIDPEQP